MKCTIIMLWVSVTLLKLSRLNNQWSGQSFATFQLTLFLQLDIVCQHILSLGPY